MYTKTITYEDFRGQKRTEDFSFNMTEVDLMKWVSQPGGYSRDQVIENMISKENTEGLMDLTESLLRASYGETSLDGKRFVKTPEVQANFFESNAYPVLFLELASVPEEAQRFFREVFPADLEGTIAKIRAANAAKTGVTGATDSTQAAIPSISTTANGVIASGVSTNA